MKILISGIVFLLSSPLFSQSKIIDSLQKELKTAKADSNKVLLLYEISRKLITSGNLDKSKNIADEIIVLTHKIKFEKGIALSNLLCGIILYEKTDYDAAIIYLNKAQIILSKLNSKKELAKTYGNLGNSFYMKGLFSKAIEYFLKALNIYEQLGNKEDIAGFSGNIGLIYEGIKDNEKALIFYNKSLNMNKEINSLQGMAINYISIGVVYLNLKKEKIAIDFFKKALIINLETNDSYNLSITYSNLSTCYDLLGDTKNALTFANKMLEVCQKGSDLALIIQANQNLARLHVKTGKYLLAEKLLLKNKTILEKLNSLKLKSANTAELSDLYYKTGNFKKAMDYHKEFIAIKDSLHNDENYRKIMEQQAQYEYKNKAYTDSIKVVEEKKITNLQLKQEKTQRYGLYGGLALVLIFAGFLFNRFKIIQKQKNIIEIKEQETEKQNSIITQQKHLVEEKHKEIKDSINYAERIQRSFLATDELLGDNLQDYFVYFKPKDVVSGDFYWGHVLKNGHFALVTADSTGHGVPGAIMSILNITSLENAIKETEDPAEILNLTRQSIINRLSKDGSIDGGKDGMDCSIIVFDKTNHKLIIAAANNPVWIIRKSILIEIKPDKMPIGKCDSETQSFTQQTFDLLKGDHIYTITDGMSDQFGGPKGKKFMQKRLKELLISISTLTMKEQKETLSNELNNWKGSLEQVDDICLIGVKI